MSGASGRLRAPLSDYWQELLHVPSGPLRDAPRTALIADLAAEYAELTRRVADLETQTDALLARSYDVDVRHRDELRKVARLVAAEMDTAWVNTPRERRWQLHGAPGQLARWLDQHRSLLDDEETTR